MAVKKQRIKKPPEEAAFSTTCFLILPPMIFPRWGGSRLMPG
jgi:hypothetical protein